MMSNEPSPVRTIAYAESHPQIRSRPRLAAGLGLLFAVGTVSCARGPGASIGAKGDAPHESAHHYQVLAATEDAVDLKVTDMPTGRTTNVRVRFDDGALIAEIGATHLLATLAAAADQSDGLILDLRFAEPGFDLGITYHTNGAGAVLASALYVPCASSIAAGVMPPMDALTFVHDGRHQADAGATHDWLERQHLADALHSPDLALAQAMFTDAAFFAALFPPRGEPGSVGHDDENEGIESQSGAIHTSEACNSGRTELSNETTVSCARCAHSAVAAETVIIPLLECGECLFHAARLLVRDRLCRQSEMRRLTQADCERQCARQPWYSAAVDKTEHLCICTCDAQKCEDRYRKAAQESGRTFCSSACNGDGLCTGKICMQGFACIVGECVPDCRKFGCATDRCETCAMAGDGKYACISRCGVDQACQGGVCGCAPGRLACGAACIDPSTDAANCGACGVACGLMAECRLGQCAPAPVAPLYRFETTVSDRGEGYATDGEATGAGIAASAAHWIAACDVRPRQGEFPSWSVTITVPPVPVAGAEYYCPDVYVTAYCPTGTLDVAARICRPS